MEKREHPAYRSHEHKHRHGTKHHRNPPLPLRYSYGNPDGLFSGGLLPDGLARNPDLASSLMKGSAITQDVSVFDVGSGGLSFLFNSWAVRSLGLKEWFGVLASAIVPFITGSILSMWREDVGTAVFFGGELEAFLRLAGEVTKNSMRIGLLDTGTGFMLDVPKPLSLGGVAHAENLFDTSLVTFPRSGQLAPLAHPSAEVVGATDHTTTGKRTVVI